MAFDITTLAQIAGNQCTGAPSIYSFQTTDTAATINTANYFDAAVNILKKGDLIYGYTDTGGTPQPYLFWVKDNDGTHVDVADGLALGTTDTD